VTSGPGRAVQSRPREGDGPVDQRSVRSIAHAERGELGLVVRGGKRADTDVRVDGRHVLRHVSQSVEALFILAANDPVTNSRPSSPALAA
jgi:hypothetical protein